MAAALLAAPLAEGAASDLELIEAADAIVVARVVTATPVRDDRGDIRTVVELRVEESFDGPLTRGGAFTLRELGGTVEGTSLLVSDGVTFARDERCLLFLRRLDGEWSLVGRGRGKFTFSEGGLSRAAGEPPDRDASKFLAFIRRTLRGTRPHPDYELRSQRRIRTDAVPSRYSKKGTRISGDGLVAGDPIRWPSLNGFTIEHRGSQVGAPNGGLDALQSAINSWSSDPASNIPLTLGSSTAVGATLDSHHTVQFEDPDDQIPASYVEPNFAAPTGNLGANGRQQHTAVFLGSAWSNKVLIAGGVVSGAPTSTALVYDPSSQSFTATANAMTAARKDFEAILIDDGSPQPVVLLAGGASAVQALSSADYFDPANNSFSSTGTTLNTARSQYTAASLGPTYGGKILIAGGYDGTNALGTAELFDPSDASFTVVADPMVAARRQHASAVIFDGRVVIAGGRSGSTYLSSIEVFDPSTNQFSALDTMPEARAQATATALGARVLVTGGINAGGALDTAELYDTGSGAFLPVGAMSEPRYGHTATVLSNGSVLITGGENGTGPVQSAEIFDPDQRTFRRLTISMSSARSLFTATRLADGKVLLAGGFNGTAASNTADLFTSPPSFDLGLVKLWFSPSTHTFGGTVFQNIDDADIVLQNGLPAAMMTNGGFDQLIAGMVGQMLGFETTFETSVLNISTNLTGGGSATLTSYDREAAGYVYPACPSITVQPQSQTVPSGTTASLEVQATGGGDLLYDWKSFVEGSGFLSTGVTTAAYEAGPGQYHVVVTNDCGSVTSDTVTVTAAPRGDVNGSGSVTGDDIDALMDHYYAAGAAPIGNADANANGSANPGDLFYLIHFIHAGGPAPPP